MTAVVHTDAVYHCTVNGGLYMLETGLWERNMRHSLIPEVQLAFLQLFAAERLGLVV